MASIIEDSGGYYFIHNNFCLAFKKDFLLCIYTYIKYTVYYTVIEKGIYYFQGVISFETTKISFSGFLSKLFIHFLKTPLCYTLHNIISAKRNQLNSCVSTVIRNEYISVWLSNFFPFDSKFKKKRKKRYFPMISQVITHFCYNMSISCNMWQFHSVCCTQTFIDVCGMKTAIPSGRCESDAVLSIICHYRQTRIISLSLCFYISMLYE